METHRPNFHAKAASGIAPGGLRWEVENIRGKEGDRKLGVDEDEARGGWRA